MNEDTERKEKNAVAPVREQRGTEPLADLRTMRREMPSINVLRKDKRGSRKMER